MVTVGSGRGLVRLGRLPVAVGDRHQLVGAVDANVYSSALEGTTVAVAEGGSIDITGDEDTFTDWTATIANPAVLTLTPGRNDGSAQFNPGLQATAVGTTAVTLTKSSSGTT